MLHLQFGLFSIYDGHGGDEAAKSVSKLVFLCHDCCHCFFLSLYYAVSSDECGL